ncbi:hypothetical protein ABH920_001645 [Catenulispora sp. EB89]|uniref:hypothetical protein n=1 Tax=Catenulispora sp. EB89 TaxID=3156257 RepID=UPI0035117F9D
MAFLLALGHRLGIAARELYADPATVDAAQASACNEMMISVFSQAWATDDRAVAGYPDADFLSILVGKADAGNARGLLQNAVVSAQRYRDAS